MADLFGSPDRLETTASQGAEVSLFDATSEHIAYEGGFSLRCDDCGTVDDECFCHGATATRIPNEGGRNVAQVRAEVVSGDGIALAYCAACRCTDLPPIGKHIRAVSPDACHLCVRCGDRSLGRPCDHCGDPRPTRQTCGTCGAAFLAKPRTPATCNLCRAKVPG